MDCVEKEVRERMEEGVTIVRGVVEGVGHGLEVEVGFLVDVNVGLYVLEVTAGLGEEFPPWWPWWLFA